MKNFLAVDTSGSSLTVLLKKDGEYFSVHIPDCSMKQSGAILPAVDEVLKKGNTDLSTCDFFAAVVGAGSFTGIRIGISVVKGFCLAYGKPSLPVTSFDTIAYNALDTQGKRLALVDALHGCYYACGYEGERVALPPQYLSEEEVLALREEGYALCASTPLALPVAVEVVDPVVGLQKAVEKRVEQEGFGELTALYVRKSSAELNLEK